MAAWRPVRHKGLIVRRWAGRIRTARPTIPQWQSTPEIMTLPPLSCISQKNEKCRITGVTVVDSFSDEQARTLVNLEQCYQVWMTAEQAPHAIPYNLARAGNSGRAIGHLSPNRLR